MKNDIKINGQEPIENLFGRRVEFSFLDPDKKIELSKEELYDLREGGVLYAGRSNKRIVLEESLETGGQGEVFLTDDPGLVAKIYDYKDRTRFTQKKLERIINFKNENPCLCWPSDILKNERGAFVGFLMPRVQGRALNYLAYENSEKIIKNNPGYSRLTQVEMILKLLEAFKYLHDRNILVGDIKLENVLYTKESFDVSIVDIDSIQIGEFNCQYSTDGYDPPEVILSCSDRRYDEKDGKGVLCYKQYYTDNYRTLDIERYSVSVLIYRFLMYGNAPYTYDDWIAEGYQVGEYNNDELCIEYKFAYGIKEKDTADTAIARGVWSHLPSFIKEAFVESFVHSKRHTDDEWIKLFTKYKKLLESGNLADVDPDCMDPFPDNEISYDAVKFVTCEKIEKSGFAMYQAVERIVKAIGDSKLKRCINSISETLKHNPQCTVDNYRFDLIYNIGVLKKIRCESVL